MRTIVISIVFFSILGCQNGSLEYSYMTASNDEIMPSDALKSRKGLVLLFLSPECPLCINYAPKFKQISSEFEDFKILGVVSGNYYNQTEVKRYLLKYDLDIDVIYDPGFLLSSQYKATITPEVVLLDHNGEKKYQGAIDNWAISLGRKRSVVTEDYLIDAFAALRLGKTPDHSKTQAVGCFIE